MCIPKGNEIIANPFHPHSSNEWRIEFHCFERRRVPEGRIPENKSNKFISPIFKTTPRICWTPSFLETKKGLSDSNQRNNYCKYKTINNLPRMVETKGVCYWSNWTGPLVTRVGVQLYDKAVARQKSAFWFRNSGNAPPSFPEKSKLSGRRFFARHFQQHHLHDKTTTVGGCNLVGFWLLYNRLIMFASTIRRWGRLVRSLERSLDWWVDENDLHTQGELPMLEKRWI